MPKIASIRAREILDSRGWPAVEVEIAGDDGSVGRACAATGSVVGRHEAIERRDGDKRRYQGRGLLRAVGAVNGPIAARLLGMDLDDQGAIDSALGEVGGGVGSSSTWGVSMAAAKASARGRREPLHRSLNRLWQGVLGPGMDAGPSLPVPVVTMISGGHHAGHNLDFQCFCVVPVGADRLGVALEMSNDVYRCLGESLRSEGEPLLVGDVGAYGPRLRMGANAVKKMLEAILACGKRLGEEVAVAVDVAASHLLDEASGRYHLRNDRETHDADEMGALLAYWAKEFPIVSIEDPVDQDDWDGWARVTSRLEAEVQVAGDDVFGTSPERLVAGIERGVANAVVVHPNAAGSVSRTLSAMAVARRAGYKTIVSARAGETEDSALADLAVATGAGQVKFGSMARSERLAKYNRLLRIESELGDSAPYAGWSSPAPRRSGVANQSPTAN